MDIVVLSGKGGTGKTTIATNLSKVMNYSYIDCDVEEPNGYIFMNPKDLLEQPVTLRNPVFNDKCVGCKKCIEACEYNALAFVLNKVMLFEELCHGCGACKLVCQSSAIEEVDRPIGICKISDSFSMGLLNLKEPMGGPIITALKKRTSSFKNRIIDAPPGTSCSVVKAAERTDYAVLVTEPTTFGLHDLKKAVDLIRLLKISFGVIINRYEGYSLIDEYLMDEKIECVGKIGFSRKATEMYSRGELLVDDAEFYDAFYEIASRIKRRLS